MTVPASPPTTRRPEGIGRQATTVAVALAGLQTLALAAAGTLTWAPAGLAAATAGTAAGWRWLTPGWRQDLPGALGALWLLTAVQATGTAFVLAPAGWLAGGAGVCCLVAALRS